MSLANARASFNSSDLQNMARTRRFSDILTCARASRAIFGHLNWKEWFERAVFSAFWITAICVPAAIHLGHRNFKSCPRPVRFVHFDLITRFAPQRRAIFHFSAEQLHLRILRFNEPTFRTFGTTNHSKNTALRDLPNIPRMSIFFLLTLLACGSSFFWLDFSSLLFTPVTFFTDLTSLLCFSTVHFVGS